MCVLCLSVFAVEKYHTIGSIQSKQHYSVTQTSSLLLSRCLDFKRNQKELMRAPSIHPDGGVWLATRVIFQSRDHRPKCRPAADGWGWEQHFNKLPVEAASQKKTKRVATLCLCSATTTRYRHANVASPSWATRDESERRQSRSGEGTAVLGSRLHGRPLQGQQIQIRAK